MKEYRIITIKGIKILQCLACGFCMKLTHRNKYKSCLNCLAHRYGFILTNIDYQGGSRVYINVSKDGITHRMYLPSVRKSLNNISKWTSTLYSKGIKYRGTIFDLHSVIEAKCHYCGTFFKTHVFSLIKDKVIACPKCQYKVCANIGKQYGINSCNLYQRRIGYTNLQKWCERHNNKYSIINYKNDRDFTLLHKTCNKLWHTNKRDLRKGYTCPECSCKHQHLHTEAITAKYLNKHHIGYIHAYVSNIRYKGKLHFDFWLPQYQTEIEYNGLQHYKPVQFYGGIKTLKSQHKRDLWKAKECKRLGIHQVLIEQKCPFNSTKKIRHLVENTLNKQLLPLLHRIPKIDPQLALF